jgi:hypothetical protein
MLVRFGLIVYINIIDLWIVRLCLYTAFIFANIAIKIWYL